MRGPWEEGQLSSPGNVPSAPSTLCLEQQPCLGIPWPGVVALRGVQDSAFWTPVWLTLTCACWLEGPGWAWGGGHWGLLTCPVCNFCANPFLLPLLRSANPLGPLGGKPACSVPVPGEPLHVCRCSPHLPGFSCSASPLWTHHALARPYGKRAPWFSLRRGSFSVWHSYQGL